MEAGVGGMADRRGVGWWWWLVVAGAVLLLVVGVLAIVIAEDWSGRIVGASVIFWSVFGFLGVRRVFVGSRSR